MGLSGLLLILLLLALLPFLPLLFLLLFLLFLSVLLLLFLALLLLLVLVFLFLLLLLLVFFLLLLLFLVLLLFVLLFLLFFVLLFVLLLLLLFLLLFFQFSQALGEVVGGIGVAGLSSQYFFKGFCGLFIFSEGIKSIAEVEEGLGLEFVGAVLEGVLIGFEGFLVALLEVEGIAEVVEFTWQVLLQSAAVGGISGGIVKDGFAVVFFGQGPVVLGIGFVCRA